MKLIHKKLVVNIIGVTYLSFLIYLLFFAYFRQGTSTQINLIPFKSIIAFFAEFYLPHWWYWMVNVPGNIIAFLPVPLILFNLSGLKISTTTRILVAISIPLFIEIIQGVFMVGSSNIDDVILNALGFYIGYRILDKRHSYQ